MSLYAVYRSLAAGFGHGSAPPLRLTTMAELVVAGSYLAWCLDGRCYQVRAGTITTPLTGDVEITDTAAEMAADAAAGTTIIPIYLNITVESLNGGTLPNAAAKSVATVSSAGAAFTPLPLKSNGSVASSTARVAGAGGVTVTAELATTTLRHFEKQIATAALEPLAAHHFLVPPILVGPRSFYVQIAGVTAGPTYFAHFDFAEMPTLMVDPS